MPRTLALAAFSTLLVAALASPLLAPPHPAIVPKSWELKFEHTLPQRIVLVPPGQTAPKAYWYIPFKVTNTSRDEREAFLPVFELMTDNGTITRSDAGVPDAVFEAIKKREKNDLLLAPLEVRGRLLPGEDQAKESVAIWPEAEADMHQFTIFAAGLSGEATYYKREGADWAEVPDDKINPKQLEGLILLRKSLMMNYQVIGNPSIENPQVELHAEEQIMR